MRIELNQKQKEYLLNDFLGMENTYKVFETCDVAYLSSKRFEVSTNRADAVLDGWPSVLVEGEYATCLNVDCWSDRWERLLELGE